MRDFLDNIREMFNDENVSTKKTIFFFVFYFIFFVILFGIILFAGDKDYLYQEYEKGDSSGDNSILSTNCVFDYKVTVDGVLHDYYGKRNGEVERFKYNNLDYYHEQDMFFVSKDIWIKSDNPYQFYELLNFKNISLILKQATLISQKEEEETVFNYLISSNSLNKILYNEDTDYDEEAESVDVYVNSSNVIEKIIYHLDHFCIHRGKCQNSLLIEMNFEMFDSVDEIDNPIE